MNERPIEFENDFNVKENDYFNSLPSVVQETILQSSGLISSEQELREAADKLINQ